MKANAANIGNLTQLIRTLRGKNGCPWDKKQTPRSLAIYLVEEVYELVDAIASGNPGAVCEELGDVLFQLLFVARLFEETGDFTLEDAVSGIVEKMVRRHPHVFGDARAANTDEIRKRWHQIKKEENNGAPKQSVLDSIPAALPALMRAYRVSERAARTGFDWRDIQGVIRKAEEEWSEFNAELAVGAADRDNGDRSAMEFGDVLFTLVNVARFAGIHPDTALTLSIRKFERRFRYMERKLKENGRDIESASRAELDALWDAAKKATDGSPAPA